MASDRTVVPADQRLGVLLEVFVLSAPGHLAEEVDGAEGRGEREVEAGPDRALVPDEEKALGGTPQSRPERPEGRDQALDILGAPVVDHIEVERQSSRTVSRRRGTANDDEPDALLLKGAKERRRIGHRPKVARPARLSSSANS